MNIPKNSFIKYIGLAHVKPQQGNKILDSAKGAYVNVIALAKTSKDFKKMCFNMFSKLGFHLIKIEDICKFSKRMKNFEADPEELIRLSNKLNMKNRIVYSSFHTYEK